MQRYGQHLRYLRKFNESKRFLEKSIRIQDTQFARHHLALTLIKLVLKSDSNTNKVTVICQRTISKKASKSKPNSIWGSTISISSPKSVQRFPNHPLLKEAVVHLEKALKMNEDFDKARYDLGLTYRYLDDNKEALKCFSRITSAIWGKSSEYKVIVKNAYEQQGVSNWQKWRQMVKKRNLKRMVNDFFGSPWKWHLWSLKHCLILSKQMPLYQHLKNC